MNAPAIGSISLTQDARWPWVFGGKATEWDALVLRLGRDPADLAVLPHVLQSFAWGALKDDWGWATTRLVWGPPGAETAVAQLLVRVLAPLPLRVGYCPRGPLMRADHPGGWPDLLAGLERWARGVGLTWLKMDPDVPAARNDVLADWRAAGWMPSPEQIQFANTMVTALDVHADEAALLAAMKSKTRYNIRLARRREVVVRHGGADDLPRLFALYAETAERQGFAIRAEGYYHAAWSAFLAEGRAAVLLAEHEGQLLAAALPVRFGDTAWYLYGASSDLERGRMAPYAVTFEMLRWARAEGCTRFDWWGGPDHLDEADPMWGVYRFKAGFGAEWVEQLGAWDLELRPLASRAYRGLAKMRASWLARRRQRTA